MKRQIKLFDPVFGKEEEIALLTALRSRYWASGSGSGKVKEFENMFKNYLGVKSCVAVNSGTAALHLALSLIDLKGKDVILPSLSFVSTAHSVIYNGGNPVFAEVDPETLCIDPDSISERMTNKTRVILPVHFAGYACDLSAIVRICRENDVTLVEDAAHAAGTMYKDKKIGSHGDMICFSFHPVKNIATPSGGAISINGRNRKENESELRIRRWCGISNRKGPFYDIIQLGWNFYMSEFAAVIGIEQLKKLDFLNKKRRKFAKRYSNELRIEHKMPYNNECSYHFYWIRVQNRNKFMKNMTQSGIETGIHYKPIHTMSMYKKYKAQLPLTESIGDEVVSIPTHPNLSDDDITHIISTINKFSN